MKPPRFDYERPEGLDEALAVLAARGEEAKVLAGGQSLVPLLNFRLARPDCLVDLNEISELAYVHAENGTLRIGAMTRQAELERSDAAAAGWPLLVEAVRLVGHPQIRNRGTVGGSVAHADPAAELPAALAALAATFHVRSARGARSLRFDELSVTHLTTSLEPDEVLVEIEVPAPPPRTGAAFVEFTRRHGDFALAGAAAVVTLSETGACERAAIALLAAGPTPVRATAAEEWLPGVVVDERTAAEAGARAAAGISPAERRPRGHGFPPRARRGDGPPCAAARGAACPRGAGVKRAVAIQINGTHWEREIEPRLLLSDFIRHEAGLTGTHVGCEHGVCGACTVQLDGAPVRSCLLFAVQADGHAVRTIESLQGADGQPHVLQQAFHELHALQCGFCTPGFLMSLEPLLDGLDGVTDNEIREALSGNLCRCTGYQNIVAAVRLAASRSTGGSS